jgi:hypothetical protein
MQAVNVDVAALLLPPEELVPPAFVSLFFEPHADSRRAAAAAVAMKAVR